MKCDIIQENISAYLDEELKERETEEVFSHIETCSSCQEIFAGMQHFDLLIKNHVEKKSAPIYIEEALATKISAFKAKSSPWQWLRKIIVPAPLWARVVQIAGVFVLAIFLGIGIHHYLFVNQTEMTDQQSAVNDRIEQKGQVPLSSNVDEFLEKSALVLMQVENASEDARNHNLSEERKIARQLISQSQLISKKAGRNQNDYLIKIMQDVEPILLEVANLDNQKYEKTLPILQQEIKQNGYVSKIQFAKSMNQ